MDLSGAAVAVVKGLRVPMSLREPELINLL